MNTHPLPTRYEDIIALIDQIDPIRYGKTRNFINGAVTQLSPYISRNVIDTRMILERLVARGFSYYQSEKFIQQLFWREFFQRVWQSLGDSINGDIKREQEDVAHHAIPSVLLNGTTGIQAVDQSIHLLQQQGMMHNHMRMYCAFLTCNLGKAHWFHPARWMYFHLLDGDWASNALSWQWVAGTFSSKKYIANQDNVNHYTGIQQRSTVIDCSYEELQDLRQPEVFHAHELPQFETRLPVAHSIQLDHQLPIVIYNYYNISPTWRADMRANRVLLLEPELFTAYPVSEKCIDFLLALSKNIPGLQVFTGSFNELLSLSPSATCYFQEHPLNRHYKGIEDPRPWMVPGSASATGSFFSFWKKNERLLRQAFN